MKEVKEVTIFDVCKYILGKFPSKITTFKLQKLCYYSQVWSLVWDEKPLFAEKIYAWANGPVCKELYDYHKGEFDISLESFKKGNVNILNKSQKETIDAVVNAYGKLTGQELSNLTHSEAPWRIARNGLQIGERGNNEIPLISMAEYYSGLYAEQTDKNKPTQ
jgi:uncharacterized phage-associated protein